MSNQMRAVKDVLISKYGCKCEVCGKSFKRNDLTGHHIIMKCLGGQITEENILLCCYQCHFGKINHIQYDSKEYWELMKKSMAHRKYPP